MRRYGPFFDKVLRNSRSENFLSDKDADIFKQLIKKRKLAESDFETYLCLYFVHNIGYIVGLFERMGMPSRNGKPVRVVVPPGSLARAVLSFVFSKKAFDSVFAQAIIDMREEHAEALANGYLWKARWVVVRDHLGLVLTVLSYLGANVVKKAVGIWKLIP